MSQLTGCVCYFCKQWHSHVSEWDYVKEDGKFRMKYICVDCKNDKNKKEVQT